MNRPQRQFLWLGILMFSFLTVRPPWVEIYARPFGSSGMTHYETPKGQLWIWKAKPSGPYRFVRVDFQRLALEWLVVSVFTGALLGTFKGSPEWQLSSVFAMNWLRRIAASIGCVHRQDTRLR